MSLKKINLSALSWQNNTQSEVASSPIISIEKLDTQKEEKIIPQEESQESQDSHMNNKRKISLKDLKKSHVSIKEESQDEVSVVSEISQTPDNNISLDSQKETLQEEAMAQVIEEKNNSIESEKSETNTPVFTITDWDTNCNIIKEEKSEIFGNYKGSFSKNEASDNVEIVEAVTPKEEIKVEVEKVERKIDSEKTNLERYADWEEKPKKSLKKRVIISSLASICTLSISWIIFLQWGFLKSNVSEIKNITPISEIEVENVEIPVQTPVETQIEVVETPTKVEVEIIPEIQTENNQVWNPDIVKENIAVEVANTQKNTKIDQKLQNYLLEKYKK